MPEGRGGPHKITAHLERALIRQSQQLGAAANYAALAAQAPGNPGANPASYYFAAIVLTAQVSGIFQVSWSVAWTDGTVSDELTFALESVTPVVAGQGMAIAQASAAGFAGGSVGGAVAGGSAPGAYICTTPGTSIGFVNPGGGLTSLAQFVGQQQVPAQGILSGIWSGAMICCNSVNAHVKTPFAQNAGVVFGLRISATDTISLSQVSFAASELQAP